MSFFTQHENQSVVPLWYGGKDQPLAPERIFPVVQSAEGKTVHYVQGADETAARAAVDAARAAFPAWSNTPIPRRREILLRFAELLVERTSELASMQVLETSCSPQLAQFSPKMVQGNIIEIASQITAACTGTLPPDPSATIMITKQAIGPVLIISPWNSPTILGARSIAAALAAGCTVVLKASELCPATYRLLCQVFADSGLPEGVLNQVFARREDAAAVTEAIISHPALRKVEFIGSANIGKQIGQLGGKHLKPVLMELGGKAPAIICRDANLQKAAAACTMGAFVHHGQICMSTERIIVVKEVAEEFSKVLKAEVEKSWSQGAGVAATKAFADKAHALIESAQASGAGFLVGDNERQGGRQECALKPTIITGLGKNAALRDTESFAPTATLYEVADEEEALELANDSAYGLSGSIWTSDTMKALAMSKRLECGMVNVNGMTISDLPNMAIQGCKGSGWGSNNSVHGIGEFLLTKSVVIQPLDGGAAGGH